jgi:hypothetical protein
MAQGNQQTSWDRPKFTIDCVLVNVSTQMEAHGCVLERLEGGHKLTTPDHLTAGDVVKVQLWLEGEEDFIDIKLAEIKRVHKHWITVDKRVHKHWIAVDVIVVSPNDQMRLTRFLDAPAPMHIEELALIDHLLIRA